MAFGRLLTAMVTPFNEQMEVDYEQAKKLAIHLIENGNDGIVVAGTTGESPNLSNEEKLNLFRVVKEAVGDRAYVVAGTGSNSTHESIALTKLAQETGVDGVMLVVPYYNKPSQEGLFQHFKAIAGATDLPVLLYNVPGRTSINLEAATTVRLAQIPNIVAIKEASGNLEQVGIIRRDAPAEFVIYSGDDALTLPMLAIGGYGIISVAGHVAGKEIKAMVELYFAGKVGEAQAAHLALLDLFKTLFITANPVPVKYATNLLGIDVGDVRLPLVAATEAEKVKIKASLEGLGIL